MRRNSWLRVSMLVLSLPFWAMTVHGAEVIESFQSDLRVAVDGTMQVTETITVIAEASSLGVVVLVAFLIGLNYLFYQLLKAPTVLGRALLDRIEGFREYLTLAEADELRLRNPPTRTPELFERLLPYAIALDVEDMRVSQAQTLLVCTGYAWHDDRALRTGGSHHAAYMRR